MFVRLSVMISHRTTINQGCREYLNHFPVDFVCPSGVVAEYFNGAVDVPSPRIIEDLSYAMLASLRRNQPLHSYIPVLRDSKAAISSPYFSIKSANLLMMRPLVFPGTLTPQAVLYAYKQESG